MGWQDQDDDDTDRPRPYVIVRTWRGTWLPPGHWVGHELDHAARPGFLGQATRLPIVRGSAIDGHGGSAGDAWNPSQVMKLEMAARDRQVRQEQTWTCAACPQGEGHGGPESHRTSDTRIFSSSESAVRREKAAVRERVFDAPTQLPRTTEPIPNPGGRGRPSRAVGSRNAMAAAHRDRTRSEPSSKRPGASSALASNASSEIRSPALGRARRSIGTATLRRLCVDYPSPS